MNPLATIAMVTSNQYWPGEAASKVPTCLPLSGESWCSHMGPKKPTPHLLPPWESRSGEIQVSGPYSYTMDWQPLQETPGTPTGSSGGT